MGIRVVPNETVPAQRSTGYLLPHERRVITVRFHPAVLIRPVAEALAGSRASPACSPPSRTSNGPSCSSIWLAWLVLVIRLLFGSTMARRLLRSHVAATSAGHRRAQEDREHDAARTSHRYALRAVRDRAGFSVTATFIVESAGQDQALRNIDHLPYPEQLYLEVCGLIFKDPGSGDD